MEEKPEKTLTTEELKQWLTGVLVFIYENIPKWPSKAMACEMSLQEGGFGLCQTSQATDVYYKGYPLTRFFTHPPIKETPNMDVYYNKQSHQFVAIEGKIAVTSYVGNKNELPAAAQMTMAKELALGENGSVCVLLEPEEKPADADYEKNVQPDQTEAGTEADKSPGTQG